jgi:hypothetical protein
MPAIGPTALSNSRTKPDRTALELFGFVKRIGSGEIADYNGPLNR